MSKVAYLPFWSINGPVLKGWLNASSIRWRTIIPSLCLGRHSAGMSDLLQSVREIGRSGERMTFTRGRKFARLSHFAGASLAGSVGLVIASPLAGAFIARKVIQERKSKPC